VADDYTPTAQVILANERTFLAWIRTSLALVATGVALEAFDVPIPATWRQVAASLLVLLGIAAAIQSWIGWRATDAAARQHKPVPAPVTRTLLVIGVIVATGIVGVGLLVS
jgi:putative membrane protein